jgi:hypothetical protein
VSKAVGGVTGFMGLFHGEKNMEGLKMALSSGVIRYEEQKGLQNQP